MKTQLFNTSPLRVEPEKIPLPLRCRRRHWGPMIILQRGSCEGLHVKERFACVLAVASSFPGLPASSSSCFPPVPGSPARINFLVVWRTRPESKPCLGMSFQLMGSYDKTFICRRAQGVFGEKLILRGKGVKSKAWSSHKTWVVRGEWWFWVQPGA